MRCPALDNLFDYLVEKHAMGLVKYFKIRHAAYSFVWVAGVSPKMWRRVLVPEIRRIVKIYKITTNRTDKGITKTVWFYMPEWE